MTRLRLWLLGELVDGETDAEGPVIAAALAVCGNASVPSKLDT